MAAIFLRGATLTGSEPAFILDGGEEESGLRCVPCGGRRRRETKTEGRGGGGDAPFFSRRKCGGVRSCAALYRGSPPHKILLVRQSLY
jgi:hypothetical protein